MLWVVVGTKKNGIIETVLLSTQNTPYGKKCTAANNFREQLANTLRLLGKHNLIWLTSIRGMFAR